MSDLKTLARAVYEKRGPFDACIDYYCRNGRRVLNIVDAGFANRVVGYDSNARRVNRAVANARKGNDCNCPSAAWFDVRTKEFTVYPRSENTLWLANVPTSRSKAKPLKRFEEFVKKILAVWKPGDVILGVALSRVTKANKVEVEEFFCDVLRDRKETSYNFGFGTPLHNMKDFSPGVAKWHKDHGYIGVVDCPFVIYHRK